MTLEERSRLEVLDAILRSKDGRQHVRPVVERVRAELAMAREFKPVQFFVMIAVAASPTRCA